MWSGRGLDVLGGVEVGRAGPEVDHVPALAAELRDGGRHGQRGGGLDALEAPAQAHGRARSHRRTFSMRHRRTTSGTRPSTSPPRETTSFTRRELV